MGPAAESCSRIWLPRLRILFITCDGPALNRKFLGLNGTDGSSPVNAAPNHFTDKESKIYFISDIPHLLKTARNCFANLGSHHQSGCIWDNGNDSMQAHINTLS